MANFKNSVNKKLTLTFVVMKVTSIAIICQPVNSIPNQVESLPVGFQQTLPNQPANTADDLIGKYTMTRQVSQIPLQTSISPSPSQSVDAVSSLAEKYVSRQITEAQSTLSSQADQVTSTLPNQPADAIIGLTKKYEPRQFGEAQSTLTDQVAQVTNVLPSQFMDTVSGLAEKYTPRQVAQTEFQIGTNLPNQLTQMEDELSEQVDIDPIAITETVYHTLEEHFGRLGPILYDLITSSEALGEEFIPVTTYAASRLGPENIRNAVNAAVELANQVDWRARIQPLFDRLADLRDNTTGLTLQDAFQVVRNIVNDPQTYEELRKRIRNEGEEVATTIKVDQIGNEE